MRSFLASLVALFLAFSSFAVTVAERSPFAQGHWWDSTRSGHGLELLNAGGQVFMVWYTYDGDGMPIWYTAQGPQAEFGERWNLMKHEWAGGRIARSTIVGGVRLTPVHSEKITFHWQLGSATGSWTIEPFRASGVVNEVDLTGHWYNPANSGWGMTLVDQGDVFGGVIYAYDRNGAPTWVAGFDRGKGARIDLSATRGTCPACTYRPITTQPVGSIDIEYGGDTQIVIRGAPSVAFADGLQIDGARAFQLGRPASSRPADSQLASYGREEDLRERIARGMYGLRFYSSGSDFSASPGIPSVDFSATNTQEDGVDEADLVKTNGRHLYALAGPPTYVSTPTGIKGTQRIRVTSLGAGGSAVQAHPDVGVTYEDAAYISGNNGLYLRGDDLILVSSSYLNGWWYSARPDVVTYVDVLSLTRPEAPTAKKRVKLSGTLVTSRRIGDRLYLVTRFSQNVPGFRSYAPTESDQAWNRALIAAAPWTAILPSVSIDGGAPEPALSPASVYAPPEGGRSPSSDMLVVTAINLADASIAQSLGIMGSTEGVYMTTSNLYVATSRLELRNASGSLLPSDPGGYMVDIHQIRVGPQSMTVTGTAAVEGALGYDINKTAFRFGEHAGKLGVVTSTRSGMWGQNQSNRLTILEPSALRPGLLKTVSWLPNRSRPQTLGKPNELLYGTRFVGDKLYAVTFKKVDPLYIVDLSNAADPRISGELEIPGFSDYLHPLPNGLLLGFGKDAKPADTTGDAQFAWFQGLQVTLFDVSGTAPREIQRALIGKRGSDSALLRHHHAFSSLRKADGTLAFAIPAKVHDGTPSGPYDWSFYPWQYSGLLRFEVRGTTPADAQLVQTHALVTLWGTSSDPWAWDTSGASSNGRSVLFPDSSIYIESGRIWRQDDAGTTTGPY